MKRNANTATVTVIDTAWKFTPATVALNGHEFAARKYDVAKNGDVYVLTTIEGVGIRLHVGKASPVYHEALEIAATFKAQPKAEKPAETTPAEPAKPVAKAAEPAKQAKPATKRKAPAKAAKQPETKAEAKPAEPAKPVEAKPAKAAKQPKAKAAKPAKQAKPAAEPAKPVAAADNAWIGTTIEGKGWRIVFDDAAQRTRVIVDDDAPNEERLLIAVADAGFYWSNTTKSWNKKLTHKAYRAAKALAQTLNALK